MTRKHKSKNKARGIYCPNPGTHDSVQYRYVSTAEPFLSPSRLSKTRLFSLSLYVSLALSPSLTLSLSLYLCACVPYGTVLTDTGARFTRAIKWGTFLSHTRVGAACTDFWFPPRPKINGEQNNVGQKNCVDRWMMDGWMRQNVAWNLHLPFSWLDLLTF